MIAELIAKALAILLQIAAPPEIEVIEMPAAEVPCLQEYAGRVLFNGQPIAKAKHVPSARAIQITPVIGKRVFCDGLELR